MVLSSVTLDDKYALERGRVFLSGVQTLTRLLILQAQRDHAAELKTAGFVTGYRGSPLGGLDRALVQAVKELKAHDISFQPGVNEELAATIARRGVLVSELGPGAPPLPDHFPLRNRIISGLSLAAVVVEAGEQSGALITADRALEQGREVFAVPGSIFSRTSAGANRLIQEGATLVRSAEDVLEALNLRMVAQQAEAQAVLTSDPVETAMLKAISHEPTHIDDIVRSMNLTVSQVSSVLAMMELKGLVRQVGGMNYVRAREGQAEYVVD